MDMDGVLVHEEQAIPGAEQFLARLRERGLPFLVLTNNSIYTRRDLAARLLASGLEVPEEAIWTSALATASFLEAQLVELTDIIALENYRARFNWAFGIESQRFSEGAFCVRPEAATA